MPGAVTNSASVQIVHNLKTHSMCIARPPTRHGSHIVSATFAGGTARTSYVPSAYYRIITHSVETTFLDQAVNNSPLTVENVVLRGFHLADGPWQFHGGYTASADFANVFLPTEKEFAAGIGYTQSLSSSVKVTPQFYFLRSIDLVDGRLHPAVIGSLLFNIHLFHDWQLKNEFAYSQGPAFAGELEHSNDITKLKIRFIEKQFGFPSLRSNSLPGLAGDFSWSQVLTSRLQLLSGAAISKIRLKTMKQESDSAYSTLRYKISRSWSAGSGVSYGSFSSLGSYSATTLTLPQQINFDRTHFGVGFQYQFSSASNSFSNGNGFGQIFRLNLGRFQIGGFLNWQSDALSVSSLYSQLPGLQEELQRQGITAVTLDQLASLLQNAAFLQTLGLSSQAQIVTVPHRLQEGATLAWSSSGTHPYRLNISFVESHNTFATSAFSDYNLSGVYGKELRGANQLQLSWSMVQSRLLGPQQTTALISASFRHRFSSAPSVFNVQKSTTVSGTVFVDNKRQGIYEEGMNPVPRARLTLDNVRTVTTDNLGHFRFANVAPGEHKIELHYNPGREHYFTTPQETVVAGGSAVNFGIAFPGLDLWGYVEDDAGNGMENIKVEIIGESTNTTIATDSTGKFCLSEIQAGSYQIKVDPATVPLGYSTIDLGPIQVNADISSAHPRIKVPAIRVLSGSVTVYDPRIGAYVPVEGAMVGIPELGRSVVTDNLGKFIIGRLPPGKVEVKLVSGKSTLTHVIDIPIQPVVLKDDFRISALNGQITLTLASTAN